MRFTDISTGVGSLVGGEFSQSLGSRLLVSVLGLWGLFAIKECLNCHIGFNVIFAAGHYDVFVFF